MLTRFLRLHPVIMFALVLGVDQSSKRLVYHFAPAIVTLNIQGSWGVLPAWTGLAGLVLLSLWLIKTPHLPKVIWLVLAAGVSNMIDRLTYGGVVDFINIGWFPSFNLADSMITLGAGWLIWQEFATQPSSDR